MATLQSLYNLKVSPQSSMSLSSTSASSIQRIHQKCKQYHCTNHQCPLENSLLLQHHNLPTNHKNYSTHSCLTSPSFCNFSNSINNASTDNNDSFSTAMNSSIPSKEDNCGTISFQVSINFKISITIPNKYLSLDVNSISSNKEIMKISYNLLILHSLYTQ